MAEDSSSCCCPLGLETSVDIDAPLQTVWEMFMDNNNRDWDPRLSDVSWNMNTKPGDIMTLKTDGITMEGTVIKHKKEGKEKKLEFEATVQTPCQCCKCCCFCCMNGHAHFAAYEKENNKNETTFSQNEYFSGCLPSICCCLVYGCVIHPLAFVEAKGLNQGLKNKAESEYKKKTGKN